jgi:molecular chaperone GrpE
MMEGDKNKKAEAGTEQVEVEEKATGPEAEIDRLKNELALKEAEAKENHARFLRSCADLENFKKRAAREKEEFVRFAQEGMIRDLLPTLDNLERAVEHSKATLDFSGLVAGVEMTVKQFLQCLDNFGVKPVKAAGERFDPNVHEAIMQVDEGEYDCDTVVCEHQKGYLLNDRLLRPCLVTVAKGQKKLEE